MKRLDHWLTQSEPTVYGKSQERDMDEITDNNMEERENNEAEVRRHSSGL